MSVGDCLEDIFTKPLTEFHDPLLMTGRAEVTTLALKGQQKFMPTVSAFDPCKAIVQDATVKISGNDLFHIGPKKTVLS